MRVVIQEVTNRDLKSEKGLGSWWGRYRWGMKSFRLTKLQAGTARSEKELHVLEEAKKQSV